MISQSFINLSLLLDISFSCFGLKEILNTDYEWSFKVYISVLDSMSHILIVVSELPEANSFPSKLYATALILSVWPYILGKIPKLIFSISEYESIESGIKVLVKLTPFKTEDFIFKF